MIVRKAIIPAGGWGTRFLPATKAQPKEMLPIVDKPAIQYVVEEAAASGITEIFIVTRKGTPVFEDHFSPSNELEALLYSRGKIDTLQVIKNISKLAEIRFIEQENPRGLGDAVRAAQDQIGEEPFAVLLPDDITSASIPCLKQMLELYEKLNSSLIAVQEVPEEDIHRYGIINPVTNDYPCCLIKDLIEKPHQKQSPSNLAIIGRYILSPAVFPLLAKAPPSIDGEIQLTDSLNRLALKEKIYAYRFSGTRFDVGDKLGFIMANLTFALQRTDLRPQLMRFLDNLNDNNKLIKLLMEETNHLSNRQLDPSKLSSSGPHDHLILDSYVCG